MARNINTAVLSQREVRLVPLIEIDLFSADPNNEV
jgi:hypothetical protein